MRELLAENWRIFLFAGSDAQAKRLKHLLADLSLTILPAPISAGFMMPKAKIAVIQEGEIFGRRRSRPPPSLAHALGQPIDTFVELNPGDYVVHVNWGIGRFSGIERLRAAGYEARLYPSGICP